METVDIHIFEDRVFPNKIANAPEISRRAVIGAENSGYTFQPHPVYWPDVTLITTVPLYRDAIEYVSTKLVGRVVLFVDLKIGPPDKPSEALTIEEHREIGFKPNSADAIPGLFLTLKSLHNCNWDGVVVLTGTGVDDDTFETMFDLPTWQPYKERITHTFVSFWNARDEGVLRQLIRDGVNAFLHYKGVWRSALEKLEADGWEKWFAT